MKIKIRFYIDKTKTNKTGNCPINCRVTYNKKRKQFSTGIFINPECWDSNQQTAEPPNDENDYINTQLSLIKSKINRAFLLLQVQENSFTIDDIYMLYKGGKIAREHNTLEVFESYLNMLKKLVGIDIKQATWNKFHYVRNNVKSFIKWKYNTNDFPLKKLTLQFLIDFEYYLKVEENQQQITINKSIQRFRKPIQGCFVKRILREIHLCCIKPKVLKLKLCFYL